LIFVCLDNQVRPDQEVLLKCSYFQSRFFQFDSICSNTNYDKIFNCLKRKNLKKIVQNKLMNFYPLLLHTDSISTGLVFNYYYSYLNKQIGSSKTKRFHLNSMNCCLFSQ
jgi:hypothetical protein